MNRTIASKVRGIRETLKNEGFSAVAVGLIAEIEAIKHRLDQVEKLGQEVDHIKRILSNHQSDVYQAAGTLIDQRIRSDEGLKLVGITTGDVYAINKHIERLERKIEELRPKPDNPYSHLR